MKIRGGRDIKNFLFITFGINIIYCSSYWQMTSFLARSISESVCQHVACPARRHNNNIGTKSSNPPRAYGANLAMEKQKNQDLRDKETLTRKV